MGWEGCFSMGKGFWVCWVGMFLAGCLSWFVALKGHCSESLCSQQSLKLLDHVCLCVLEGLLCQAQSFVILIIQPLVSPDLEEGWIQLMAEQLCLVGWKFWDGLESLGSLLGTWWAAYELRWRMKHLIQTIIMASEIAIIALHPCIQLLMQQRLPELPSCFGCWAEIRISPTFLRNKPMNTVVCGHSVSEGSSGDLWSMEPRMGYSVIESKKTKPLSPKWAIRKDCHKDPMITSRMHKNIV